MTHPQEEIETVRVVKKFRLTVVSEAKGRGVRCVYLNERRIVGSKPYVSENLSYKDFSFTLDDLQDAFRGALVIGPIQVEDAGE